MRRRSQENFVHGVQSCRNVLFWRDMTLPSYQLKVCITTWMCVKDVDECLKSAFIYMCNWDISDGPAAEINFSTGGLGEKGKKPPQKTKWAAACQQGNLAELQRNDDWDKEERRRLKSLDWIPNSCTASLQSGCKRDSWRAATSQGKTFWGSCLLIHKLTKKL